MPSRRTLLVAALAGLSTPLVAACSRSDTTGSDTTGSTSDVTLVIYNAQHENLVQPVVDAFTKATGIKAELRNGDDSELSNQIVQEGKASPADVFLTENSPGMTLVDSKGLFAPLQQSTLDQTPAQFRPSNGKWTGFAARSTVLPYNTDALTPEEMPNSILELADPGWKGRFGISPAGADFQAIVSAVVQGKGEAAAAAWLTGLKTNAKVYQGNSTVMKAVNTGQIEAGVIYHYYWFEDQAEGGANSDKVKLKFLGGGDPGAFLSVSGAGVLASSTNLDAAQQFVAFLTSAAGQQAIVASPALEYTIASGVTANAALPPLADLDPPTVDVTALNGPRVVELMQQAGLL